jgi:hypothetical protein
MPNPSLNLTRYGKRRKPGLQHMVHHCSPGLRRSPPRTLGMSPKYWLRLYTSCDKKLSPR